jgi:hypothetical protein
MKKAFGIASILIGLCSGAFAQRGHNFVTVNAPPDFVKMAYKGVLKIWGRPILTEGEDSISCMVPDTQTNTIFTPGTHLIYYFEPQGRGTLLSLKACLGSDCERENPIESQNSALIKTSLQTLATAIEQDYSVSAEKIQRTNDSIAEVNVKEEAAKEEAGREEVAKEKAEQLQHAQKDVEDSRVHDSIAKDNLKTKFLGKNGWLSNPDIDADSCSGPAFIKLPNLRHYTITAVEVETGYSRDTVLTLTDDLGNCYLHKIGPYESFDFSTIFSSTSPRKLHPKWSERIWKAIEKGSAIIGMTEEQARMSWGEPDNVNRTTTRRGTSEQWVYGSGSYLYFTNGILDSIQN